MAGHVLIVEDNEINQQVAVELLETAGYTTEVANNGEEAVALVQRNAYDLVLMDMQMPVMDGLAATIAIRKLPGLERLPIVAMTANAMRQDRDKCMAVGMNAFVTKPIDPEALLETLAVWIAPGDREAVMRPQTGDATLPDIAGVDVASGLARVGGNAVLYRKLLGKMAREFPGIPGQIRAALAEKTPGRPKSRPIRSRARPQRGRDRPRTGGRRPGSGFAPGRCRRHCDRVAGLRGGRGGLYPGPGRPFRRRAGWAERAGAGRSRCGRVAIRAGREQPPAACPPEFEAALRVLQSHLEARKPKPCAKALAALQAMPCPVPVRERIEALATLVGRYKFPQALEAATALLAAAREEHA